MYEVIIAGMTADRGVAFASSDRQASETRFAVEANKHKVASVYLRKDGEVIASNEPSMQQRSI